MKQVTVFSQMLILLLACMLTMMTRSTHAAELLWVIPTYPASEPEKKSLIVETQFDYHLYTPHKGHNQVHLVQRKYASLDSADDSFVSRMSAISSVNYSWWLDTWQPSSKQLALQYYQQKGLDQPYWEKVWREKFVGRKIRLKQKVIYNDYIVMVYNVSNPNGKESYLDLPVVLKKESNDWLVSLDLRQSPLLRFSPWVEGIDSEKVIYE
ncbi:hypothetical protein [Psychrobium sp. 1_MG-2023]|uniref:hypothetical protein n=1 Tax=Psychrobium sp. 1_MG-2023 TaxID=3062624 RepID=UPI00273553FE|nr:hypothetical protein [Psychrobium sp. 1_MG-2023]MDP2560629.1 hypothetical protein [Psychrobium sp. 1_MG-2023]